MVAWSRTGPQFACDFRSRNNRTRTRRRVRIRRRRALRYRVAHEFGRDRVAPRPVDLAAAPQIGRHAGIEHVGIGPVLVHPAPWVAPIVEHLAAQRMAADAPEVLIALLLQLLVAEHVLV